MDNIAAAEFAIPPLTTESRTHLHLGRHAVEMLIGMIEGQVPPGTGRTLTPELVVRQSTAPAPIPSPDKNPVYGRSLSCPV
jgi:DNA-binding LacI/PurR family transcriptional regulator